MSFPYRVRPTAAGNRFQGQPAYKGSRTTEEILAALATRTGKTAAELGPIVQALCELIVDETIDGWRIEPLFDLIGYQFGCGGSEDTSDFSATFDNLNMGLTGHTGTAGEARSRAAFSADKVGEMGRVVPVIIRVTDMRTGLQDHYAAGGPIQVELANNRVNILTAASDQGIFLKASNGSVVRITDYAFVRGRIIAGTVPAGLTGPQELSVGAILNGSIRTGIYPHPLAP